MKNENEPIIVRNRIGTPYDDVFRTLLDKCRKLIIPVINEVFKTGYSMDEKIEILSNEHYAKDEDSNDVKRITDSCVKIRKRLYHIECESRVKSGMEIRMIEYDFHIALANKELKNNQYIIRFPESAIMYLRHTENTPDELEVTILMPDGRKVPYKMPTLKVQKYSKEELFDKNLLFFIPYYILKFENQLENINDNPEKLCELLNEYGDIYDRLVELEEKNVIDYAYLNDLVGLTSKLVNIVAEKSENIRREVGIMNGRILETPGDKIREMVKEATEAGLSQGISQGISQSILDFLKDVGDVTEELEKIICEEKDIEVLKKWNKLSAKVSSVEEFEEKMY